MDYEKKYKQLHKFISDLYPFMSEYCKEKVEGFLPELKESEDELTWLTKYVEEEAYSLSMDIRDSEDRIKLKKLQKALAWLEKQGSEPNWCHHKVDLSNCSEEYRKAYYDGWNNCNQQHSQCKSEWNDVVKCLINGMKFYYEDNEEATWGTEKFSMKVKDILSWLEKQGGEKPAWSEEDECYMSECIGAIATKDGWSFEEKRKTKHWLESLKQRYAWKPSDEQMKFLQKCIEAYNEVTFPTEVRVLSSLYNDLKKLKGE